MTVTELRAGLRSLLDEYGYSKETTARYEREWDRLRDFLVAEYGDEEFDMERGAAYLDRRHGIAADYDAKKLTRHKLHIVRMIHLLEDYKLHGVLTRRYLSSKNPIALAGEHLAAHEGYVRSLATSGLSKSTVGHYESQSLLFLDYLGQRDIAPSDVDVEACEAYVRTLAGYTYKTVEQHICSVRHLLRHLRRKGVIGDDVASALRMPHVPKAPHVPSAWDPEDLKATLGAVDRSVPLGKRDYAMLLVASVLGLRGSDIKALRFGDFDWRAKRLRIVQSKTGRPLDLPVPDLVGWAVIDYARNGRPSTEGEDHVFVSHRPPFRALGDDNHLEQIVAKYMGKAGVRRDGRRRGFHSLRHTAGAMMLDEGTPLPVISSVLGHADVDVTATYLKVDIERLRDCLTEVPSPTDGAKGGACDDRA